VGLSSYLILWGLYYSAISVSDDTKLRRTIRESALRESKFLDSIGKAYIGQEIELKVLEVTKELKEILAEQTGVPPSLTEDEIKQYLSEVLTEVKKGKGQSSDN
jgi:hypothetical protein